MSLCTSITCLQACVRQFMNHLRSTYLNTSARLPTFQETSVEEALAQSNRTLKPLLIYLHTDLHEASAQFVRQTLSDPVFCDFIEQTFVVWGASVHNTDGFAAASKFSAAGFPFIGVYAPVTGSTVSRPKYQRVWSHEDGFVTTNALKTSLQGACASVLTSLETIQADRQSQIFERQLREDQDRYVKASVLTHLLFLLPIIHVVNTIVQAIQGSRGAGHADHDRACGEAA
jgi:FAS-associated factor 2